MENIVEVDIVDDEIENGVNLSDDLFRFNGYDNDEVDQFKKKWHGFNVSDMDNPIFCVVMLFANKKHFEKYCEECQHYGQG